MNAPLARAPRAPSAKALNTRRRLIETAMRLFAERGYEQTSVRDLGHELGMTTGAIYRHFRNKAELLAAAVLTSIGEQVDRPPHLPHPSSYLEGAANLMASHPDTAALRALMLDSTTAAKSDPAVREQLHDVQAERFATWAKVARRDQQAGLLVSDASPETLVKLLWALEFGLVVFDVFGLKPPDPVETGRVVDRLLTPTGGGPGRGRSRI